jgi:hypothetical protein
MRTLPLLGKIFEIYRENMGFREKRHPNPILGDAPAEVQEVLYPK